MAINLNKEQYVINEQYGFKVDKRVFAFSEWMFEHSKGRIQPQEDSQITYTHTCTGTSTLELPAIEIRVSAEEAVDSATRVLKKRIQEFEEKKGSLERNYFWRSALVFACGFIIAIIYQRLINA